MTPNGVSPMAIPGTEGGCYAATGLEHTERGTPNFTSQIHEQMSGKRALKIREASKEPGFTTRFGPKTAKIGIIGWGSTQGAISEGMELAAKEGITVAQLQLKMVYPLPEADVLEFVKSVDKVVVAELNYSGQLNNYIRSKLLLPTISFTKTSGMPFYADEILTMIRDVAGAKPVEAALRAK
jgi:2-oxoglutarate ferredoxin oxidoreductase subunit alpha